jgi:uncharacterized protein YoxC
MQIVAEVSLAVIAAAFLVAVLFLVPALRQVTRTAREAERVLARLSATLPGLLTDLRNAIERLDGTAGKLHDLSIALDRLGQLATTMGQALERARTVIMPSVANIVGVFTALREGFQSVRASHARGRDES